MMHFSNGFCHSNNLIFKILLIVLGLFVGSLTVQAQAPRVSGITRKQLLQQALPMIPIAGVALNEITLAPGQRTPDHHHPGEVYTYILAGEVRCQPYGQPARILRVGECFREAANQRILAFNNNSPNKPCRFVAFYLLKKDQPSTVLTPGATAP